MLKLGSQNVQGMYLNGQKVKRAYLGNDLVLDEGAGPAEPHTISVSVSDSLGQADSMITSIGVLTVAGTVISQTPSKIQTVESSVLVAYTLSRDISKKRTVTINGENVGTIANIGDSVSATVQISSDTFVTVHFQFDQTSRLPAGYTEVEYIAATDGNCTVNTGIAPTSQNVKTIIDFEPTSAPTSTNALIAWSYYAAAAFNYSVAWTQTGITGGLGTGAYSTVNPNTARRRMTVTMDNYNGTITADGRSASFTQKQYNRNAPNVFLFGVSGGSNTLKGKLYSCKMYVNDSLARDFVPCKNPSGVSGLYDLVSKAFFGSVTSTVFTAGPAV